MSFKGIKSIPLVHSVHPLLSAWVEPPTKFKKRGLPGSHSLEGAAGKEGSDLFQKGWRGGGGCSFYIRNKQFEIFDKKVYKQNFFSVIAKNLTL